MRIIIKQIRINLNISLEQLEEDTGINRKRLADIENNKVNIEEISFIEMFLIADSFGKRIEDLFVIEPVELQ